MMPLEVLFRKGFLLCQTYCKGPIRSKGILKRATLPLYSTVRLLKQWSPGISCWKKAEGWYQQGRNLTLRKVFLTTSQTTLQDRLESMMGGSTPWPGMFSYDTSCLLLKPKPHLRTPGWTGLEKAELYLFLFWM